MPKQTPTTFLDLVAQQVRLLTREKLDDVGVHSIFTGMLGIHQSAKDTEILFKHIHACFVKLFGNTYLEDGAIKYPDEYDDAKRERLAQQVAQFLQDAPALQLGASGASLAVRNAKLDTIYLAFGNAVKAARNFIHDHGLDKTVDRNQVAEIGKLKAVAAPAKERRQQLTPPAVHHFPAVSGKGAPPMLLFISPPAPPQQTEEKEAGRDVGASPDEAPGFGRLCITVSGASAMSAAEPKTADAARAAEPKTADAARPAGGKKKNTFGM